MCIHVWLADTDHEQVLGVTLIAKVPPPPAAGILGEEVGVSVVEHPAAFTVSTPTVLVAGDGDVQLLVTLHRY